MSDEKKPAPGEPRKVDIKQVLKDDVVGVSDFRRSKIGSLTGFSAASKVASDFRGQLSDTAARTGGLLKDLTGSDNVPSLPDGGAAAERFEASVRLHRRSESDILAIIRNSCRSTWLYAGLSIVGTMLSVWSVYSYPVTGLIDTTARIGPLPIVYALTLKHAYTNWMVRRRSLDNFVRFIKSGEWMPSMQGISRSKS